MTLVLNKMFGTLRPKKSTSKAILDKKIYVLPTKDFKFEEKADDMFL